MDSDFSTKIQKQKISRERRKELKNRLKKELGDRMRFVYIASFLSWIQFLMRIISFGFIAKGFSNLYNKIDFNLFAYVVIAIGLNIFGFWISIFAKRYQGVASQYARNNLKVKFFDAFSKGNEEVFKGYSTADVLTVASQGIDSLDTFYSNYLTTTLRTYFNCATILLIVAFIYPLGGLVFLVSIPFIPVSIVLIQKRSAKIMQHYWSTYMDVSNLFMDDLKGLNTLYSYSADAIYEKKFNESAENFRLSTMELLKFQLQSVGYMDGVMYLGIAISGFLAVLSVSKGNMSIFNFIFFVLIATEFFTPIRELGYCMHLLMMNTKMADRIFTFLDSVKNEKKTEVSNINLESIDNIEFKNLSFSYENRDVLNNINLSISKGSLFAIAGESGLGKSTFAKILFKNLEDYSGEILIDGKSLRDFSKSDINVLGFYVSPDSYVFNESIMDNLKKATKLSEHEILEWIEEKNILKFVKTLPDGFNTIIGENGRLISPGQRQQIICVRSLLANRKIYIFDEMTSSVDTENEIAILDLIKMISKNSIVMFISHKMKQVNKADFVLFMGKEKSWDFGKPEDLYNSNFEYRLLLDKQNEMEEILNER
ncbi:ABC transporter ATP-binding protein/permease [Parvimonas sp. D2]|uniref:ABC transporter ATP-binding protein/permease n=1 Tax=unclassified Parvimonas TaxID=1151464 RepID=UPI002B45E462|nr:MULTISPECIES: ABC transporter ATP-binding protein/permease [unclassified Parvimonas]MEB3012064.1 ABC transporter ATP-binding protein/permease [Parvimonas sp. D2]MEB3087503.1 ABC transporter ATP-binding protein/permease [Parvimonas sp. D4]